MKEVFIVGEMRCLKDKIGEVQEILDQLRAKTRQEDGCIYYQFFEAEDRPGVFATIEHWNSEESEAEHWKTIHLKEAAAALSPLLVGKMQISRYNRSQDEVGCH
ncbi:putative quinol monooxygenase [Marinifilum caeruleilacunae]|uniref:Antibiotic biosynthesis monooxygenase n=1 Tax=Marinifilum caeruleilacunae TaxID=2499076 RepID=A0ABX1WQL1_9BACT|nr:putative quinol monooxygenase [Marinifilum caeruleilacunae]NOU58353.1 antibiotic biosynthesis monooxygenase [Marinifilum caeruleilacunae]